ncbi:MAG: GNAT family N-acetyltransferase [Rhizomicrobium sp.]
MTDFSIRKAVPGDEALILTLLHELADYEKLLDVFHVTEDIIRRDYLGAPPLLQCEIAFAGGAAAGIMTWYWTYASFAARRAIYLEDLFVRPVHRGKGYGKALLTHLAKTGAAAGAQRLEWSVLDWNKPSIEFYDSLGARPVSGWYIYRLDGEALKTLGGG